MLTLLLLFAFFIGHAIYVSGATVYLGDFLFKKIQPNLFNRPIELKNHTRDLYQIATLFCTYIFIYSPTMIIAKYLGIKKHKRDYSKIN